MPSPLRYTINDWNRLPECLSNNSQNLKIEVSKLLNNDRLKGLRIAVEDKDLGTLFATVLDAAGTIATIHDNNTHHAYNMPKAVLLEELAKYGFDIQFSKLIGVTKQQIQTLKVLAELKFDKIRKVHVISYGAHSNSYKSHVILFKADKHPELLEQNAIISYNYFAKGLSNGTICDISNLLGESRLSWYWLDFVGNIEDIIKEGELNG